MKIKETINDLLQFVKSPNNVQIQVSGKEKIDILIILGALKISINLFVILPILYLINKIEPLISISKANPILINPLVIFALGAIVAPIVEELVFRLPLRYGKLCIFSNISPNLYNRFFKYIVYLSVLSFGFIHITNYQNSSILFYCLSPLIVLPQLLAGFLLSYIRVRLELLYSILFHSIWNGSLIILAQLIK